MDLYRCYYCGEPSDTIDHVVPQSLILAVRDSGDQRLIDAISERHRRMTVPSCRECNSLAGAVYDQTLADRRARVAERFARRYHRQLEMPDWSNTELMSVRAPLRRYVLHGLQDRETARRRLRSLKR